MQRRRRRKAEPKNIFGTGSQSSKKTSPSKTRVPKAVRPRPQAAPPSVPGAKPNLVPVKTPSKPEKNVEDELENKIEQTPIIEENIELEEDQISIEKDQILGDNSRKDIGITKTENESQEIVEPDSSGKSQKAMQIIQDSLRKATKAVLMEKKESQDGRKLPSSDAPERPKKPQKKLRNRVSSYQPASRAKRLDRSRHMEYKYEMRGLLVELGVAEEHRSNLLATIWARGERQTINEAKEFLKEKLHEGAIDSQQMESLEKVVDGYTIRR